ncbi:MAG: hypothetical protein P1V36_16695 [Planctomycetota bacterium]|nr:hypothetical protein [Planctomycetota bacterium]
MAGQKREYSAFQKKLIKRYYENREAIDTQRLQEIVTEIYLAQGGKKAERLWEKAEGLLARVDGLDKGLIEAVVANRDVEALAEIAGANFG